jgi:hypothetical protein
MAKKPLDESRMDIWNAILIAVVSLTTALVAWRTNVVGSSADDKTHQGLVDQVKKQASANESWRKVYEEAAYGRDYSIYLAGVQALENSGDDTAQAQAVNLRQYLLPNLQLLSAPLGSEVKYLKRDGTYDLEQRFADLENEASEIKSLDPAATFERADNYFAEQRWLTVSAVLLAVSLFWLAMAEIGGQRFRKIIMFIGGGVYLFAASWFVVVEAIFVLTRGGVL